MKSQGQKTQITVLYEHDEWFKPLFRELDHRGVPFEPLHVNGLTFDAEAAWNPDRLLFNRMSPSAWQRGRSSAIPLTTEFLALAEKNGVTTLNGTEAWRIEVSKAAQLELIGRVGLKAPPARVIHDGTGALNAAQHLRFPLVTKPNIGGSGAGVRRFDSIDELREAVEDGSFDLGLGGVGLLQEFIPARGGHITRVEVLDGAFLYAIAVSAPDGHFDLCPADFCLDPQEGSTDGPSFCPAEASSGSVTVEAAHPPEEIQRHVEALTAAAGIEVGGVEYIIDDRDGQVYYYDINALSNFVTNPTEVIGFDPFENLVDWLARVAAQHQTAPAAMGV